MKVARSSPLRTGRLYPQEFFWYSFLEAELTPGHMVPSVASEENPQRLVAQCLNHYAITGPNRLIVLATKYGYGYIMSSG
jgi:hypothetical protein